MFYHEKQPTKLRNDEVCRTDGVWQATTYLLSVLLQDIATRSGL